MKNGAPQGARFTRISFVFFVSFVVQTRTVGRQNGVPLPARRGGLAARRLSLFTFLRYTPASMSLVAHHHGTHHHPAPAGSAWDRAA
jgi:hypothetical protein